MNDSDLERLVADLAWRGPSSALDDRVHGTLRTVTIRADRARTSATYAAASLLAASLLAVASLAVSMRQSVQQGGDSVAGVAPAAPASACHAAGDVAPAPSDQTPSAPAFSAPPPSAPGSPVATPFAWNRIAGVGTAPSTPLVAATSLATAALLGDPSFLAVAAAAVEDPAQAIASIEAFCDSMTSRRQARIGSF